MCMLFFCCNDHHSFQVFSGENTWYTKLGLDFFQRNQLRQQQLMNRIRHTEGVGDGSCNRQTWEDNKRNNVTIDYNLIQIVSCLFIIEEKQI